MRLHPERHAKYRVWLYIWSPKSTSRTSSSIIQHYPASSSIIQHHPASTSSIQQQKKKLDDQLHCSILFGHWKITAWFGGLGAGGPLAWPSESRALPLLPPSPLQAPGPRSRGESHRHRPARPSQNLDLLLLFDLLLPAKWAVNPDPCAMLRLFSAGFCPQIEIWPRNAAEPARIDQGMCLVLLFFQHLRALKAESASCCDHQHQIHRDGLKKSQPNLPEKLNVLQSQLHVQPALGIDKVPFRESFACNARAHEPHWQGENAKACPTTGGVEVWIFSSPHHLPALQTRNDKFKARPEWTV